MVCFATGKQSFSRKRSKRAMRHHRKAACERCCSGWYAWTRYVCRACGLVHLGHWWMGATA